MKIEQISEAKREQIKPIFEKTDEQLINEGIMRDIAQAVDKAVLGAIFGTGALLSSAALSVMGAASNVGLSLGFWASMKVVLINAGVIEAGFLTTGAATGAGMAAGITFLSPAVIGIVALGGASVGLLGVAFWETRGERQIARILDKLDRYVQKRDSLIKKFNSGNEEKTMPKILELNDDIKDLSAQLAKLMKRSQAAQEALSSDNEEISDEEKDRLRTLISMAEDKNDKRMTIISNLDRDCTVQRYG